jgi:hypothetical protein
VRAALRRGGRLDQSCAEPSSCEHRSGLNGYEAMPAGVARTLADASAPRVDRREHAPGHQRAALHEMTRRYVEHAHTGAPRGRMARAMTDCVINPSDGSSIVRSGAARA